MSASKPLADVAPDLRHNTALAASPYGRRCLLDYEMEKKRGEVCRLFDQRLAQVADHPDEFFQRARDIVRFLGGVKGALGRMPGREFFADPAERFVGDLIHDLEQALASRAGR